MMYIDATACWQSAIIQIPVETRNNSLKSMRLIPA